MSRDFKYYLNNLEEILCGFFLVSMVALVIVNVLLRFLFSITRLPGPKKFLLFALSGLYL